MTAADPPPLSGPGAILLELWFQVERRGDELVGRAEITPPMHAPGTDRLRTSIVAAWTDVVWGLAAVDSMQPRVPVTLDLDVHLFEPLPSSGVVEVVGRPLKHGRAVTVFQSEIVVDGTTVGAGTGAFMPAPDPRLVMPGPAPWGPRPDTPRLSVPLAERAGIERPEPGVAIIGHGTETTNAARTLNGGLVAVAIEEAALSLTPGETLALLDLHFLQPVRVGPAVARADIRNGVGRVEVRDAGMDDRLAVMATTRTFLP